MSGLSDRAAEAWAAFERLASNDTLASVFDDRREAERHRFLCGCAALSETLLHHWKQEIAPEWGEFLTFIHALKDAPERQAEFAELLGDRLKFEAPLQSAIEELSRVHAAAVYEPGLFKGALAVLVARESRMQDPELRAWLGALFEIDAIRAHITGPGSYLDEMAIKRGLLALNKVRGLGSLFAASFARAA